jgi:hypothetical protein
MPGAEQAHADGLYSGNRHSVIGTRCGPYKLRADASISDFNCSSEPLSHVLSYNCAVVFFVSPALPACGPIVLSLGN